MWTPLKILIGSAVLTTGLGMFVSPAGAEPTGARPSAGAITYLWQCQSTPEAGMRRACYDSAIAPAAEDLSVVNEIQDMPRIPVRATPRFADMLAAENAKLRATLKTICRGC